jgi:hypothetical protein
VTPGSRELRIGLALAGRTNDNALHGEGVVWRRPKRYMQEFVPWMLNPPCNAPAGHATEKK